MYPTRAQLLLLTSLLGASAFAQTPVQITDPYGTFTIQPARERGAPLPHEIRAAAAIQTTLPPRTRSGGPRVPSILGRFHVPTPDLLDRGESVRLRGEDFANAYWLFYGSQVGTEEQPGPLFGVPETGPDSPRSTFFAAWVMARVLESVAEPISEPFREYGKPAVMHHLLRSFLIRIAMDAGTIRSEPVSHVIGGFSFNRPEPAEPVQHLSDERLFQDVRFHIRQMDIPANLPIRFHWEKDYPLHGQGETDQDRIPLISSVENPVEEDPLGSADILRTPGVYPLQVALNICIPDTLEELRNELTRAFRESHRRAIRSTLFNCGNTPDFPNREARCGPITYRPDFMQALLRRAYVRAHGGVDLIWPSGWERYLVPPSMTHPPALFGQLMLAPLELLHTIVPATPVAGAP